MRKVLDILEVVLNNVVMVGLYILSLAIFWYTKNTWPLKIIGFVTLFCVAAGGYREDNTTEQNKSTTNYLQAIAVSSVAFILYTCIYGH